MSDGNLDDPDVRREWRGVCCVLYINSIIYVTCKCVHKKAILFGVWRPDSGLCLSEIGSENEMRLDYVRGMCNEKEYMDDEEWFCFWGATKAQIIII